MTVAEAVMVQDGRVSAGMDEPAPGEGTPTLEFVGPVAGFPDHRHFVLVELEGLLYRLQSLEDPGLRFLVVPPIPFFADYAPEVSDEWAQQLQLTDASDALVLLIVTTGNAPAEATANLLAPIVINLGTRQAAQIVLEDSALALRAPLLAAH